MSLLASQSKKLCAAKSGENNNTNSIHVDDDQKIVNAHGACIGKTDWYTYLRGFGEYRSEKQNFCCFSCYLSDEIDLLPNCWKFECTCFLQCTKRGMSPNIENAAHEALPLPRICEGGGTR